MGQCLGHGLLLCLVLLVESKHTFVVGPPLDPAFQCHNVMIQACKGSLPPSIVPQTYQLIVPIIPRHVNLLVCVYFNYSSV